MTLNTYRTWEGQFIQIKKGNQIHKPIIIGNIYRPPKELIDDYKEFTHELSPILQSLESTKNEVLISGDFNVDLLKVNDQNIISDYFDMLTSHSFYPKITLPTRFTNKHGTLIDNFLCKLTETTLDTTSGILCKKFSDHQPYFTILNNFQLKYIPVTYIKINKQNKESIEKFEKDILASNKLNNINADLTQDPNINYNILNETIQMAKDAHMPHKLVRFNKYKHKKCKWITHGIIKSIHFRDNLYKKHKTTNPDSPEYEIIGTNLKTYNNILKKSIRLAQKNYYESLFHKFKGDMKGTWKTISDILNKTRRKKTFPLLFKDNEQIITDKLKIANKFNSFFTSIGPNLAKNITIPKNKHFKKYLTLNYNHNFNFKDIEEATVNQIINNLAPKTSLGFDGISTKLVKTIKDALIKPITIIINQMLNTGIFPEKLKIAKITPIHKKDDDCLFTNYRPISLLPAISKIFEKVIFKQLYEFFQKNKLFYYSQYGFRTEHSTEFAALEVIDRILVEMDKNDIPINIYLDLSKAFDTLDHDILIDKLNYYGIRGVALKLFRSYLTNRKQFVEIDETQSETLTIQTGVPQGSILGPLLFIIYMNDIAQASKIFDFIIYADDTTLSGTLKMIIQSSHTQNVNATINTELENINTWLKTNKLSLNVSKTKYMLFHTPCRKVNSLQLQIDGKIIERVKVCDFLGLTINENLTWKDHVNKISNKISKSIGILNRLKHFLPLNIKTMLYSSLILSHLNFGILNWGYACERITKLQKKAIRIISTSKYNAHTEPIFKSLNLLKVKDILKLQELKFYYKFRHNKLPHYLQQLPFHYNRDIHNHETRQKNNLHVQKTNHEYAKYCIRYNLPKSVNSTPNCIIDKIETHSLQGYAIYIKKQIITSYQESCNIENCYICSRT